MKKAINKTERHAILKGLVVDASLKSGKKIVGALVILRAALANTLQQHWQDNMPGVDREDQLKLIQNHCVTSLSFSPTVYKPDEKGKPAVEADFVKYTWRQDKTPDAACERLAQLASAILEEIPNGKKCVDACVSTSWQAHFALNRSFADIIRGFQPSQLYREGCAPEGYDQAHANRILPLHDQAVKLLEELKDLIFAAEDMYQTLALNLAPVKTAEAMAELMPEAVKHFPPSLTYVKPTKELADPKAINEIRAKLAKGLPI